MKNRTAAFLAVGAATGIGAAGLPAGPAVADGPVPAGATVEAGTRDSRPDLTTVEGLRSYMESLGISTKRVEDFAAARGLSATSYYEAVLMAGDSRKAPAFPVEFSDGKIRYRNTVVDAAGFTRTGTSTQSGKKAAGRCVFDALEIGPAQQEAGVAEVVDVDPAACTRTVVRSTYDPTTQSAATARGTFIDCTSRTGPPTRYQPGHDWVDGEYRAYYKQSFVDPVCITITSSTLNVRWKNAVNSSTDVSVMPGTTGRLFYYTELRENWPSSKKLEWLVPRQTGSNSSAVWSDTSLTEGYQATTYLGHQRTETDFPEHLLALAAVFGIAGFTTAVVACAADFSDTGFNSRQTMKVRRNGHYSMSGSGDAWGGCSSLVHERTWYGSGAYAR